MTRARALDPETRRALLRDLSSLKVDDDDAVAADPKWFLPLEAHAHALRLETLVVRGGRGAGKSALFHFLGYAQRNPTLLNALPWPRMAQTEWLEGFGSGEEHPSLHNVGRFAMAASNDEQRFFWFGSLCGRVAGRCALPLPEGTSTLAVSKDPAEIVGITQRNLSVLGTWLDAVQSARNVPLVVTYDNLDRVDGTMAARQRFTASLLAMWLSLSDRYRRIRPKVFVREDLFQGSLAAFPDASKLDARSVSLDWRVEDLYRVLIKHMANTSDGLKAWLEHGARAITLSPADALGWMPPALPEEGAPSQRAFAMHLAGEHMGKGAKKGMTYRWIPNRLQDAHARAVPRSILSLVRNAAEVALRTGPGAAYHRLLTPAELSGALEKTSLRRVNELKEEYPVVSRLENLRGQTVMLARKTAIAALDAPTADEDEFGSDGNRVLHALIELGVASERSDGRIDIPDLYRYGFGISRKGGVKRSR